MAKKVASYTIDEELLKQFDDFCEENSINKSALIGKLIEKHLKENGR